jgi:myo-inositol-1(or 4)-monophosphatase
MRRYGVRRFGSTALHLCYVALGGLDFVHDDRASLRDIAGAAPVLLESGGLVTSDSGAPLFPLTPRQAASTPFALLAGHPRAHAEALRDLRVARTAALVVGVS